MMPVRPIDGHGARFHTALPLALISLLQDDGWVLTLDTPATVELARGDEHIRIDQAGQVQPFGDESGRTARMLLLNSEEHS